YQYPPGKLPPLPVLHHDARPCSARHARMFEAERKNNFRPKFSQDDSDRLRRRRHSPEARLPSGRWTCAQLNAKIAKAEVFERQHEWSASRLNAKNPHKHEALGSRTEFCAEAPDLIYGSRRCRAMLPFRLALPFVKWGRRSGAH